MKVLVLLLLVSLVAAEPESPKQKRSPDDDVILFYNPGRGAQSSTSTGRTSTGFNTGYFRPRYFIDFDDLYDDRRKRQTPQSPAVRRQKRDADFDDDDDDRVYVYHGTNVFSPAAYTATYSVPTAAATYSVPVAVPTVRTAVPAAATTYAVQTTGTSFVPAAFPTYVPTSRYVYVEHDDDDDDKRKKRSADFDFDDDDDFVARYVYTAPRTTYTTQQTAGTFAPVAYVVRYDD
ncbi:uncharacterized protein [Palaemon carinicauda]|uniref:uncharacterized protein n=1 Tax=Palaemon carinicauda TaxID=392227 RepID=UPI0035B5B700